VALYVANYAGAWQSTYLPVILGAWNVIVARHNGVTLYLDRFSVTSSSHGAGSVSSGATTSLSDRVVFGRNAQASPAYFSGYLIEPRAYPFSATDAQLLKLVGYYLGKIGARSDPDQQSQDTAARYLLVSGVPHEQCQDLVTGPSANAPQRGRLDLLDLKICDDFAVSADSDCPAPAGGGCGSDSWSRREVRLAGWELDGDTMQLKVHGPTLSERLYNYLEDNGRAAACQVASNTSNEGCSVLLPGSNRRAFSRPSVKYSEQPTDGRVARVPPNVEALTPWGKLYEGAALNYIPYSRFDLQNTGWTRIDDAAHGGSVAATSVNGTINNLFADEAPTMGTLSVLAWAGAVGVAIAFNTLTDTAAAGWGNSGAASTLAITGGDGYVECTMTDNTKWKSFGLSNGDTSQSYTDIDFCFMPGGDANLYVYEGGVNRGGPFGTYVAGDVLRVAVIAGVVKYLKNGVVAYTSAVVPTYPLICDTALFDSASVLSNIMMSGLLANAGGYAMKFIHGSGAGKADQSITPAAVIALASAANFVVSFDYTLAGTTWSLQRSSDSKWWNDTTPAWQVGACTNAANAAASNGAANRYGYYRSASTSVTGAATNYTLKIITPAAASDAAVNWIGHVQLEQWLNVVSLNPENAGHATSRIVTGGSAAMRMSDSVALIGSGYRSLAHGTAYFLFRPLWNDTDGMSARQPFFLLDLNTLTSTLVVSLYYDAVGGGVWRFADPGGATCSLAYTASRVYAHAWNVLACRWTGSDGELNLTPYTRDIFVNGVKGVSGVFPGTASTPYAPGLYGGDVSGYQNSVNAHIRRTEIIPRAHSDAQILAHSLALIAQANAETPVA
jgi:hypothetical protein